jgi:hypothetical protein
MNRERPRSAKERAPAIMQGKHLFEINILPKRGTSWPIRASLRSGPLDPPTYTEAELEIDLNRVPLIVDEQKYGRYLGEAVFRPKIEAAFRAAIAGDARVHFGLSVDDAELSLLNWRLVHLPFAAGPGPVGFSARVPFSLIVRSVSDRQFPTVEAGNVRALVLAESPPGLDGYSLAHFDAGAAATNVVEALSPLPSDVLRDRFGPPGKTTLDSLVAAFNDRRYALLHIVCHGRHVRRTGETILYLSDADGKLAAVEGGEFIGRLTNVRFLPHFVFLATCESAISAGERVLDGLAQRMVRELGIPAVIAMTDAITVATAGSLGCAFYRRLKHHGEVDVAFAEALSELREQPDAAVPAVYSRLVGGLPLFEANLVRVCEIQSYRGEQAKDGPAEFGALIELNLNSPRLAIKNSKPIANDRISKFCRALMSELHARLGADPVIESRWLPTAWDPYADFSDWRKTQRYFNFWSNSDFYNKWDGRNNWEGGSDNFYYQILFDLAESNRDVISIDRFHLVCYFDDLRQIVELISSDELGELCRERLGRTGYTVDSRPDYFEVWLEMDQHELGSALLAEMIESLRFLIGEMNRIIWRVLVSSSENFRFLPRQNSFLTKEGVEEFIRAMLPFDEMVSPNVLLLYESIVERYWLVRAGALLYSVRDNDTNRATGKFLVWTIELPAAQHISIRAGRSGTGRVDIGPQRGLLYSAHRFATPLDLHAAISRLLA